MFSICPKTQECTVVKPRHATSENPMGPPSTTKNAGSSPNSGWILNRGVFSSVRDWTFRDALLCMKANFKTDQ